MTSKDKKVKQLEDENMKLRFLLGCITNGIVECPKCGYYTVPQYICFHCGWDHSVK